MKNKRVFHKDRQKGIALLIAILTSGVVLVIGTSVMEIALKEMKLSSLGRESTKAFYAADTGLECALYWDDLLNTNGGTIFPKDNSGTPDPTGGFDCAGSVGGIVVTSDASSAVTEFGVIFGTANDPCAFVSVSKFIDSGNSKTSISSRGRSSCNSSTSMISERGVKVTYWDS